MELLDQEKRQLILLKKDYNAALKRYNKMTKWCETATIEEQEKNYKHIVDVINDCSGLLNEIKALDPMVNSNEILNGFEGVA